MKNLKLNPLQSIYNNCSILMDRVEKETYAIGEKLVKRLLAILSDPKSYNIAYTNEIENFMTFLKRYITFVCNGYKDDFSMLWIYEDLIDFMVFKEKESVSNLYCFKNADPICSLTEAAKEEIKAMFFLFKDLEKLHQTDYLFHAQQLLPELLPERRRIDSLKFETQKAGLTKKDWQSKIAA